MGRKGVDCGCGAREDILDRLAALRQRVEVLETEINQVESQFPDVLRDVRSAEASAVSAAESAGASAEIVEGYDDRLGAVEQGVIDVNDYAEAIGDDVSAIDTEIHTTRPYMTTNTEQTITAKKHIPTATVNDDSDVWVNKAFVQATDGRNNLVHNIGNEIIGGLKKTSDYPIINQPHNIAIGTDAWREFYTWDAASNTANENILVLVIDKQATQSIGLLSIDIRAQNTSVSWLWKGIGVADNRVIVARNYATRTAYLYIYGYRIATQLLFASRATTDQYIKINSSDSTVEHTEPTNDDFDIVVKI